MNWQEFFNYKLLEIGSFKLLMGNLMIGIAIAIGTWILVATLRRIVIKPRFIIDKIDSKRRVSIFLILKYFIWVISAATILEVLGVKVTMLLVGSTALLVGLGLGLQNIFKDLISGLFLLFEGTIKIGDIIEADGVVGRVVEINLRSSQLQTRDDVTILIPNSRFVIEKVINWSHNNETIRFDVGIGLAYGSDVDAVFECLESAMLENDQILFQPKPYVRFKEFAESSLEFEMIFWSKEMFMIENVKSDLRKDVYKKLKERNLVIPFPQRDLHIKGIDKLIERANTTKDEGILG
jgi:small-conductance mechanosensitive channel